MLPLRVSLPTPFAVGPVNAYLWPDDPVTLVDPGPDYGPSRDALLQALAGSGLGPRDIAQVIVTHYHPDHAGYAPRLADEAGARLLMHPETARRLRHPRGDEAALGEILRRHGVPEPVVRGMREELGRVVGFLTPLGGWEPLNDGARVAAGRDELTAHLTPGHASGHLVLAGPGYLLGGDLLIAGITPNPILEVDAEGTRVPSLPQYLQSVERVRALGPQRVLSGHRGEIGDLLGAIADFVDDVALRQRAMREALSASGPATAFAISQRFFPLEQGADPFLALGEALGHVDLLVAAGLATWQENAGQVLAAAV